MNYSVLVPLPLEPLTYSFDSDEPLPKGSFVLVPVRNKKIWGIVLKAEAQEAPPKYAIKKILELLSIPPLDSSILELILWSANYYHYSAGEILRSFFPEKIDADFKKTIKISEHGKISFFQKKIKRKKINSFLEKLIEEQSISSKGIPKKFLSELLEQNLISVNMTRTFAEEKTIAYSFKNKTLNEDQNRVFLSCESILQKEKFTPILLEGITGSGKTEIYIELANKVLEKNKSVLILVPEISLTPQLLRRFSTALNKKIGVIHSGLTPKDKFNYWSQMLHGEISVCLGARSAIFTPMQNIGLIIVDEEHDSAYKQEDHFRYQARDLSIVRAKLSNCAVILGSATPSLESYHNVKLKKYEHYQILKRHGNATLPIVKIIKPPKLVDENLISPLLEKALTETLNKKKQALLLLNRKGYASFLTCKSCGHVPKCTRCSVSLTYYKNSDELKCSYCGLRSKKMTECEVCEFPDLSYGTPGTESLEIEIKEKFPSNNIDRIDSDTTKKSGSLEKALERLSNKNTDIAIGTQMISKGHDFPDVQLVGVVNADSSLNFPDFRSSERTFQLLTQMAGRAGRLDGNGIVYIQSNQEENPSIKYSAKHDYKSFAEQELLVRKEFSYPPFSKLARLLITAKNDNQAKNISDRIYQLLSKSLKDDLEILGPSPAILSKIKNHYRWQILLKAKDFKYIRQAMFILKHKDFFKKK
ncbi:MAG: primosomal protein N' [Oligoflexia bacterium]|nr:primosomal protein N' [Oligoflexia bacterium]